MRTIIILVGMVVILRSISYITALYYYSTPEMTVDVVEQPISTYDAHKMGKNVETHTYYYKINRKTLTWREGLRIKSQTDTTSIAVWQKEKR